ncbi:MAG: NYN domain-containing protein [Fuerstiella sp.]
MATPFLIIDGYNLMHAAGIARHRYAPGMLQRCRHRLQLLVADLLKAEVRQRTTVVYDAFESVSDDQRESEFDGLRILFAPQGSDADSEIERQLATHSSPRQILVVSSDHRLHKAARRRRARCIDSEKFLNQLTDDLNHASSPRRPRRAQPPDTAADLQHWMSEFSDIESTESATDACFDRDYLNRLQQELDNDRLK